MITNLNKYLEHEPYFSTFLYNIFIYHCLFIVAQKYNNMCFKNQVLMSFLLILHSKKIVYNILKFMVALCGDWLDIALTDQTCTVFDHP